MTTGRTRKFRSQLVEGRPRTLVAAAVRSSCLFKCCSVAAPRRDWVACTKQCVERHANCDSARREHGNVRRASMSLRAVVSTEEAQRRVDGYFATQVSAWTDIYNGAGLVASIYQRRLAVLLRWISEAALAPRQRPVEIGFGAGLAPLTLGQRGVRVDSVASVAVLVPRT